MASEEKQSTTESDDIQEEAASYEKIIQTYHLSDSPPQTYNGETVLDNLHGSGIYFIDKPDGKIYIDGLFYCNKLEGYCHVYYEDGSSFQGLFKDNRRFGPGVFTYPNGHQDVGIWKGFSLARLSTPVHEFFLPKLAESIDGIALLRRFRYVLPVGMPRSVDVVTEMLRAFAADGVLAESAAKFYNTFSRNRNNLFFNATLYDDLYFDEEQLQNSLDELERLREQLKKMDNILIKLQEVKSVLFEKIEYCKDCCHQPDEIAESVLSLRKSVPETSQSIELNSNNVDDLKSTMTETMTFDDMASFAVSYGSVSLPEVVEKIYQNTCICDEEMNIEDLAFLEKLYEDSIKEETFYYNVRMGLRERLRRSSLELISNDSDVAEVNTDAITEALAWNNEPLMIDILKHCFLHRKSENRVNVKLSAIFDSHRFIDFSHPGHYEMNCEYFLTEAASGYVPKLIEYLKRSNVDVNVTDSRGNNAVFFAAAKQRKGIIGVLVNFGANLNQINDEGLTPLNMCILSYLAQKNNVQDWERAFLPVGTASLDEEKNLKWHPGISTNVKTDEIHQTFKRVTIEESYIFNTNYREQDGVTSTDSKAGYVFKFQPEDDTIISLLNLGADPKIGEVPFTALLLAMYSENPHLVEELLKHGADVRIETPEENLNCLHIIASLECNQDNVGICSVLLKYGCDPNVKTDEQHWPEQNVRITGNYQVPEEFLDTGKNPLQMLCLRKDFGTDSGNNFIKMAELLIDYGIDINDTYLGLNALELAVSSGNLKMVEFLLKTGLFDPYRLIDPNIGNTLTLFLSERFKDILPLDDCKQMIEILVNLGVSPLHRIGDYENAIEFMERDDCKGKKGEPLKKNNDTQMALRNLLKNLARKMILDNIKIKSVQYLYNLTEAGLLDEEAIKVLAEYLTPEKLVENIKLIFEQAIITVDRFNPAICQEVMNFVTRNRIQPKAGKKQKSKLHLTKSNPNTDHFESFNFDGLLDSIEIGIKRDASDVNHGVCFQCLKSHDKTLTMCPRCGMLYFCSTQCNKANLKQKNNEHVCALNVFEHTFERVGLMELCELAEHKCQEKLSEKKRKEIELRRKKEEEARKLDIYGRRQWHKAIVKTTPVVSSELLVSYCGPDGKSTKYTPTVKSSKTGKATPPVKSSKLLVSNSGPVKETKYTPTIESAKSDKATSAVSTSKMSIPMNLELEKKLQKLIKIEEKYAGQRKPLKLNMKHKITQIPKKRVQNLVRDKCGMSNCKVTKAQEDVISPFENLPNLKEHYLIARKTSKEPPRRTKFFIELLKKYFPNVDLSYLLMPYICYTDGHLYYQFSEEKPCKNYSLS